MYHLVLVHSQASLEVQYLTNPHEVSNASLEAVVAKRWRENAFAQVLKQAFKSNRLFPCPRCLYWVRRTDPRSKYDRPLLQRWHLLVVQPNPNIFTLRSLNVTLESVYVTSNPNPISLQLTTGKLFNQKELEFSITMTHTV